MFLLRVGGGADDAHMRRRLRHRLVYWSGMITVLVQVLVRLFYGYRYNSILREVETECAGGHNIVNRLV